MATVTSRSPGLRGDDVRRQDLTYIDPTWPQFGAVGDGVADDTAALQAAIDFAGTAGIQEIRLPAGQFMISNTLSTYASTRLIGVTQAGGGVGEERRGTKIRALAGFPAGEWMIENYNYANSIGDPYWHWAGIRNIEFRGLSDKSINGLNIGPMGDSSELAGLALNKFATGLYLTDTQATANVDLCSFYNCTDAIHLDAVSGHIVVTAPKFDSCTRCMHFDGGAGQAIVTAFYHERSSTDDGATELVLVDDFEGAVDFLGMQSAAGSFPVTSFIRLVKPTASNHPRVRARGLTGGSAATYWLKDEINGTPVSALTATGSGTKSANVEWGTQNYIAMAQGSAIIGHTGNISTINASGLQRSILRGDSNNGLLLEQISAATTAGIRMSRSDTGTVQARFLLATTEFLISLWNSTSGTADTDGGFIRQNGTEFSFGNRENDALVAFTNNTEKLRITALGDLHTPAGATDMTAGFLRVPAAAGTPTGTPASISGTVPLYVDTTANKLYFYSSGAWRDAGP